MYTFIRRVHLYTALVLLLFVLMYFISGMLMVHGQWLPAGKPQRNTSEQPIHYNGERSPQAIGAYLESELDLPGRTIKPQQLKDGSWKFTYSRPGESIEAIVAPATDRMTITSIRSSLPATLTAFHRLHGYSGGPIYLLWALVYDLVSVSMILFTLSGIYLWYKSTARHWPGYALLAISLCYAIATVVYLVRAA